MKRYDSITAIKAISCMMVFLTHWNGAFLSWGHVSLDWLFLTSPFRILTFGNMAVCVFLMLSGTLVSLKLYRGGSFHWKEEMMKRYLRMAIPILAVHLLIYVCSEFGLFRTGEAAVAMGNSWLFNYYQEPILLGEVFKKSFVTSIFRGDSSYYGPLWMMNYIFFGTVFSVILTEVMKGMRAGKKTLAFGVLLAIFLVLNSYYLCFVLGNLMALLICRLEESKTRRAGEASPASEKRAFGMLPKPVLVTVFACVFIFGVWLGLESFVIVFHLQQHGVGGALGDASFWGTLSGFFISLGLIFVWELLCSEKRTFWKWPLLWLGERSYSVFLVHWIVICTFSCGFYCRFLTVQPNWFYLGVNFFVTAAVIFLCTEIFYQLIEKRAYMFVWNRVRRLFEEKQ